MSLTWKPFGPTIDRMKKAKTLHDLITYRDKKGVNPKSVNNLKHVEIIKPEIEYKIAKLLRSK